MPRNPVGIVVHCAATRPDWMDGKSISQKKAEITKWHKARGWRGIGYHWLIDRDGTEIGGRDLDGDGDYWEEIGAHVRGKNKTTIGICLFGGHASSENDAFADHFTPEQDAALRARIADLRRKFPSIKWVKGHNEFAAKACPGFRVGAWMNNRPPARSTPIKSTTIQAAVGAAAAGGTGVVTAVSKLDGQAQIVIIVAALIAVLALAWIVKERLRKWGEGDR